MQWTERCGSLQSSVDANFKHLSKCRLDTQYITPMSRDRLRVLGPAAESAMIAMQRHGNNTCTCGATTMGTASDEHDAVLLELCVSVYTAI